MYQQNRVASGVSLPNRLLLTQDDLFTSNVCFCFCFFSFSFSFASFYCLSFLTLSPPSFCLKQGKVRMDVLVDHLKSEGRLELECCHHLLKTATNLLYNEVSFYILAFSQMKTNHFLSLFY